MKQRFNGQRNATPCGSTDNRKRNKTASLLHPFKNGAGKLLLILCLLMASVGAWAADYVLTYTTGGTTYYLARNGTTGVTRVNTFNPTTCIWSCETAAGAAGTLNNSNTYGYLYQTVNGTKYYLYADVNAFSLKTDRATNNYSRMRTNGTYVYNRYSNSTSYYINLANNAPARATTSSNTCARPYQVTTNSVAQNNNGITAPTISCSGLSGSAGIQLSRTGVGGSYIPAHTTYAFNNQTIYYYNNTAYTNTNQFAVSVNANDATYNWSVTAGTANVSTTGVVTLGNNNTQNVTVRCRATINGVNKDATYTLNATATAALNETAYSDIEITPSSQTLDLRETVTYTVSPSISRVTKTRPQYVTVTDAQGHTHYKVGTTYQAAEPAITETPGAAINFTSFNWSAAEGGAYFTLDPYYSASSNQVTLTRSAQKTGTQQTFTISVTGVYGGQNKTASATVTIPATKVDLTALHAGAAINIGMGSSEGISSHYTYEPDYDAAGSPYLKFKYTSANTSVATVDESGKVTAVGPGSTTITVTAVKLDGTDGVTCNVTVNVTIDAPTISIDGSGNVTITHPVPGVQIRYTTNGTDPTATTGTVYTASFAAGNEQTIKAIAVANGVASPVASEFYATSGVSGSKVILNDYMDHSWTLFQPQINGEENPIYYANPKDVKITYKANGGAVSISESADQFVYYKTLTDDYKYTTIPNPFSKRPRANGNYQGFSKWKITSISGGTIVGLGVNSEVNAETELTFNPTNEYGMEVVFEVVWTRAYVVTCAVGEVNANLNSNTLAGNSYETNFIVITSGTNSTTNLNATTSKKVTITMVTPDGATDYRTGTRYIRPQTVTLSNDWKFEYINMNNNGTTITANNHNLVLGRGISNTSATGVVAGTVQGVNAATNNNLNYHIRMESGRYTNVDATMQGNNTQFGGTQSIKMTVGCDYDRANNEDNSKLYITDRFYGGNSVYFTNAVNKSRETLRYTVKSGTIHTSTNMSTTVNGQFYFGIAGWTRYTGKRTLIIEGGNFHSISGGLDYDGNNGANDYAGIVTSQYANADDVMVEIQMRGGTVRGSIYGAAQFAAGKGIRKYVFTGGTINGWVAGGCNGTNTTGGQTYGSTQIYVGGNNHIIASNANPQINSSYGGNVFGAGSGIEGGTTVGQVNNSTLVVADQSIIGSNVFGGGNYGYVMTDNTANTGSTKIYVTGGTVRGKVFGGSNQQQGQRVNITMTGGTVEGGVYGGSNITGTINQNVTMNIVGGQVGTSTTPANIHGGGYGQSTVVTKDVDITLGKTGAAPNAAGVTVYGDVYGGSALGKVNGTSATNDYHTNVTMNAGTINGSLYGGGLGDNSYAANVYGPVSVTVNGGVLRSTDQGGLGAVFGCNNRNGSPQGKVTVDVTGGEMEYIYGGGNAAPYTVPTPNSFDVFHVHMSGGLVHKHVFGGGLGANAVLTGNTEVKVTGGSVVEGNVYGGGHGAEVTGDTHVVIGQ
ncbi:MAG: chitobiase/beta-hexosaminidase C-terminal domain-containing protein [Bacteroidales bacterium]|nr:chitobiase/beta-hexosaminidase C-terminal domain-containing protein [Bacteroidales bacterium]